MEENNRPIEQNTTTTNDKNSLNIDNTQKTQAASQDVSQVKIRHILKQRLKNMSPGLKRAIPLILVAIIFFAAGVGADRFLLGRRMNRNFMDRPGMNQRMTRNPNKNMQDNGKFNKNIPNKDSKTQ